MPLAPVPPKMLPGQKHLNRVAPVQIGPHAVHHGVELVGLALGAHVLQRPQQIGKEQYAQIGVPAEALAVFQIGSARVNSVRASSPSSAWRAAIWRTEAARRLRFMLHG